MPVQVSENSTVRHDGVIYQAGEVIHTLEEEAKTELVKLGVVKDLENVAAAAEQVEDKIEQVAPAATQAVDGVAGTVAENVKADLEAAERMTQTPGTPVGPTVPAQ